MKEDPFFNPEAEAIDDTATLMSSTVSAVHAPLVEQDQTPSVQSPPLQRYQTHEVLAQGAMGRILLAQDRFLSRRVAFKEVRHELRDQAHILNGFLTEAQITAQLEHPGVIPIYTMEQHADESLAYTMKLVHGTTLKAEIEQLKSDLDQGLSTAAWQQRYRRLLEWFLVVCDTVDYAHHKGIVHRDLKPSNIMIGAYNEVYVLDWGIASLQSEASSERPETIQLSVQAQQAPTNQITGTPRYMSPEQAYGRPEALRPTSDLFSLGLILYELSFLKPAFYDKNLESLLRKVRHNQQAPAVSVYSQVKVPRELQAIIRKATQRPIRERYGSVRGLSQDLRAWLKDQPTVALPDTRLAKMWRWFRHHPQQTLGLVTLLLLVCTLGIALSLWWSQQAVQQSRVRRQAVNQLFMATVHKASAIDKQLGDYDALLKLFSAQGVTALGQQHRPLSARLQSLEAAFAQIQTQAKAPGATDSPLPWGTLQYHGSPPLSLMYPDASAPGTVFQNLGQRLQWPPHTLNTPSGWGKLDGDYVPLYQGLYTASGQYLGWSAFLIHRDTISALLAGSELAGLRQVWLVNAQNPEQVLHLQERQETLPPALLAQLPHKKSGYFETPQDILAYQQLNTLPWHLIFQVDRQRLWKAAAQGLDT